MKYVALVTVDVGFLRSEPSPDVVRDLLLLYLTAKTQLETMSLNDVKIHAVMKVEKL